MTRFGGFLLVLLLATGCSTNDGFAVELSLRFGDTVGAAALDSVAKIELTVPQEGYSTDLAIPSSRKADRTERTVYYPEAGATSLTFQVTAVDAAGNTVATGSATVTAVANKTIGLEVLLDGTGIPDGGTDASPADASMHDGGTETDAGLPVVSFVTTPTWTTCQEPIGLRVADFDSNGANDVAVACTGGAVQIFLAGANHVLPATPSSTITSIAAPTTLGVGDFGGDGALDLVVADRATSTLVFLINDGTGTFTAAANPPPTQASADSMAVGDFDHDGKLDIALGSSVNTTISIYKFLSNPAYAQQTVQTGGTIERMRTADLNADGYSDLIFTEPAGNAVCVRLSIVGNLLAGNETKYGLNSPHDVGIFDFEHDSDPYVMVLGEPVSNGDDEFPLVNSNGSLSAAAFVELDVGHELKNSELLDLDGTGMATLFTTAYGYSAGVFSPDYDTIHVDTLLSSGEATSNRTYVSQTAPDTFDHADMDGDGKPDLVVANRGANSFGVLRQLPGGSYYAAPALPSYTDDSRLGDANGDGTIDIVESNDSDSLWIQANDGLGNFTFMSPIPAIAGPVAVANLKEDGAPDLVYGNHDGNVGISIGTTPGSFAGPVYVTGSGLAAIDTLAADINGDEHTDVVVLSDPAVANGDGNNVSYLVGDGTGALTGYTALPAPGAIAFAAIDLDGDKVTDIVTLSSSPAQLRFFKGGSTGLATGVVISSPVSNATSFVAFDADRDGKLDLVVGGDSVHVLHATGSGTFVDQGALFSTAAVSGLGTGDVDGDGAPELFAVTADSMLVTGVLDGQLVLRGTFAAGAFTSHILVGDLTSDGRADAVAVSAFFPVLLKNDSP